MDWNQSEQYPEQPVEPINQQDQPSDSGTRQQPVNPASVYPQTPSPAAPQGWQPAPPYPAYPPQTQVPPTVMPGYTQQPWPANPQNPQPYSPPAGSPLPPYWQPPQSAPVYPTAPYPAQNPVYPYGYQPYVQPMAPPKPVKPAQQVNLSKISNRVGFGLSGLMVFNLVLAFGITWLVMWVCLALSANIGSVASLASSSEFLWVVQFSVTTLACGGAILLLRGLLKIKIRSFFQRPYHGAAYMAGGSVVALGVNLTVGLIITSVQMMLNQFFDTQGLNSPDFSLSSFSPVSLVFYLLAICVAAPLLEEIIFRGYVLRAFQRYGNVFAILVSSFAFGLYHGNLTQALQTTCVGLVLAYVALRSNSLIPCVIIHVINNAIAVISTMASDWLPEAVAVVVNLALVFLPIILSIVVLAVYARNLRIQNNNLSGLKTGICVTTTLLSPGMIVFVAISLLEVVIYLFG